MFCTVYKLKKNGQRLPPEVSKAAGVRGELRLTHKRPSGMPSTEAVLLDALGNQILSIRNAEVRRIESGAMLIRGGEETGGGWESVPQLWWCVVDQPG